jgi:hypothetical protein
MHSKPWVIATVVLCVVYAVLGFPIFLRAKSLQVAIAYTLIGFAVIWIAYYARAWVFTRPGFWNGRGRRGQSD